MNAAIIERNWVVEWFDERQCYHMPSLTMAPDGTLLAVWNGGFLQWNGDPMGRDAKDWVSRLELGAKSWSNPDAVGCDIRYCCHDPIFLKNRKGEIILLFAKFLDTEVNFTTWCNGRDELWMRKTQDNGRTWLPAVRREPVRPRVQRQRSAAGRHDRLRLHQHRAAGVLFRRRADLPLP